MLNVLNYIGSKHSLLQFIESTIRHEMETTDFSNKKFADLFSGTSSVGFLFRTLNCSTIYANDMEYYSYVIARASLCSNYTEKVKKLMNVIILESEPFIGCVSQNYSESGDEKRMFFSIENANRIDGMRMKLEEIQPTITESEYYFLLASIIVSADKCANVPAIYGSFLKEYKKSAVNPIKLEPIHTKTGIIKNNRAFQLDCVDFADKMGAVDFVYLDPPYNERQYSKNYHILNYIARYDESLEIYGKTGLIKDVALSDWCSKKTAPAILDKLLEKLHKKTKYVFMSYNNEGIIGHDAIKEIFEKYFDTKIVSHETKRFKNFKYNDTGTTIEYLWVGKAKN
jgi:adenine-specific DNA-methyltransferase